MKIKLKNGTSYHANTEDKAEALKRYLAMTKGDDSQITAIGNEAYTPKKGGKDA